MLEVPRERLIKRDVALRQVVGDSCALGGWDELPSEVWERWDFVPLLKGRKKKRRVAPEMVPVFRVRSPLHLWQLLTG